MSIEARRAPTNFPDARQRRIVGVEAPALLERKRGKPRAQALHLQRLIPCCDIQLQEAPRPPRERPESPLRTVGNKLVAETDNVFACNLVAIPFVALIVVERLGIREANRGISCATHRQLGIRGGQVPRVDQDAGARMRRNGKGMLRELRWNVDTSCANHLSYRSKLHSHGWQRVRHKLPISRGEALPA